MTGPRTNFDPWLYVGNTSCLDVQAALADPNRNVTGSNFWTFLATAASAHNSGAGVKTVHVHSNGSWTQQAFLFGGEDGFGTERNNIAERINFDAASPQWTRMDDLSVPTEQNNVVALPDGHLLVVGGRESFHYQMYDPVTGHKDEVSCNQSYALARTNMCR